MSTIIQASLWLTLSELFFNLSGYFTHAILGRTLGPAEYGRYGITITIATMIVVLIGRGVPVAMSKYLSEVIKTDPGEIAHIKKVGWQVQIILIALTTLLYYFLAEPLAYLLNDISLAPLFKLSTLVIPAFAGASFYVYYFTGLHLFNVQSALKFFRGISKIFFIVFLAFIFKTKGAILGHVLAPFSVFLLALMFDQKNKRKINDLSRSNIQNKKEKKKRKKLTWKILLNFAWPITLFMIFYEIMITIDLYMVKGLLRNDSLTGYYNAALTLGRLPFYAFYFLTIILLPKISETTSQKEQAKTNRIMSGAMRFLFILLIPSITLLSIFAPSALQLFYGSGYREAVPTLRILSVGLGFLTIFYILAFVLNGAGKNKIPMWTALVGMIVNIFLNYQLIPRWGIVGAGIATTTTSFLIMLIAIIATEKFVASFLKPISLVKYFLATSVIAFLALNLQQGEIIFILWSVTMLTIYFIILWLLQEVTQEDLTFIQVLLKAKNKSRLKK